MAFANACGGDFHKLGALLHVGNGGATAVAHAGAYAARHLEHDGHHRALVRHTAFNALWHQFVRIGVAGAGLLEVAVGTALLHGADAAHAAVAFVAAPLEQHNFAWRLFSARKHAAHHHARGTRRQGLGNVAAKANAAIGNQRHARAAQRGGHVVNSHDLGHTHARHNAGGANAARANAHFHGVSPRLYQRQRSRSGGNVAAHHVNVGVILFDPAYAVDHALAVAVGGVHHNGIYARFGQGLYALFSALTHPYRSSHAQLALGIACSVGEAGLFGDVFHGDQAFELKGVVHHQQSLNFVLV